MATIPDNKCVTPNDGAILSQNKTVKYIEVVSVMPSNPDPNTLYILK